jgi:hypothetical protein
VTTNHARPLGPEVSVGVRKCEAFIAVRRASGLTCDHCPRKMLRLGHLEPMVKRKAARYHIVSDK